MMRENDAAWYARRVSGTIGRAAARYDRRHAALVGTLSERLVAQGYALLVRLHAAQGTARRAATAAYIAAGNRPDGR